jgi:hypothetical protein
LRRSKFGYREKEKKIVERERERDICGFIHHAGGNLSRPLSCIAHSRYTTDE